MRANEFLSEGRKPFNDLKSWASYAKAQGLSVKRSSDPDWSYYAADNKGNVRGKFVSTHASQNSRGYINEGLKDPKDNPCWKGYKPVGTKKKAGKTVPNCVPVKEFTDLEQAIMEGGHSLDEGDGVIRLSGPDPRAQAWIDKVYELYPYTWQNNHVMSWGKGPEQEIAMFELQPSKSRKGAVEIYWFQAYPLRKGVGSRAMAELQRLAREDGIALTLYPWDKGQVSQAKLVKFYKAMGFKPTAKASKNMYWDPNES